MTESVFRHLLSGGMVSGITVTEVIPTKGKPSRRELGSALVWVVSVRLGDGRVSRLESVRGGAREWSSLDRLDQWLRSRGILEYAIQHNPDTQALLQRELFAAG